MSRRYAVVRKYVVVLVGVAGCLLAVLPARAHHSIASQYDFKKEVELTGKLVRMAWISPHPLMRIEVTGEGGTKVIWTIQMSLLGSGPTAVLQRAPSEGGLKVGETYTAFAFAAKDGKAQAYLKALKMPDGKVHTTWFGDPNG